MFKDLKPIPTARGDERYKKLKILVGEQIQHNAHFYATSLNEVDSARNKTTAAKPVSRKATDGLHKRLTKGYIDVEENARKLLTGGKVCMEKLKLQTTKHASFANRDASRNRYTSAKL